MTRNKISHRIQEDTVKKLSAVLIAVAFAVGCVATLGADAKGDEIAAKYFARVKADDTQANAVMTLIDKSGNKKVRELDMFTKNVKDDQFSFIEFKKPADVAGTKFLITPTKDGDTEQRLYLPALKKTRKIASNDKSGEFVNSDLFYYDMEDRKLADSTYTFLDENVTIADKAFEGMKFYKIEVKAKATDSPYAKSVFYINMDDFHAYKVEAYDKNGGALLKTILFVKYEDQKGVKLPVQTSVTNHKKGTKTLLQLNNLKVNAGLADSVFSVKALEQ
jgi:outer membrane lipoprotein-sorting protein